ncbi:hypothetical protein ACM61V_02215 [Sphingomonas sp. TX0543]|uniref:hypothetical protein n=1 Tax=unclassified Sphingomonas TaxID=196159 RepID=UPI0010FA27E8|nr:hypothetical protein [Sphingomonas sp. 3P27F8]
MTPDRAFDRDSRTDIEGLAHRSGITLPGVLRADGTASDDQIAKVAPGTNLKLALLPHRELGADPVSWPGAAIVGTREPEITAYLDRCGPVAGSADAAASIAQAQSRDAILSWLYDVTGFRYAPAALWKLAGWQIGWAVDFLDRLKRGGAEGALSMAERQAAAAVRAMWVAHDQAQEVLGLATASGAVPVGHALIDLIAAFDRICDEAITSGEVHTIRHRNAVKEARALLVADLELYCARISEADRAATAKAERARIGGALEVARRIIQATAMFTVASEAIGERIRRLVHVLKTKAKVARAPARHADIEAGLSAANAGLDRLICAGLGNTLEHTAWPIATRIGLGRLGLTDRAARLALLDCIRTDLIYKLIVTRRLDRLYRVLPWMAAPSEAFPLTFAGPLGAIAQLFEAARAREIALELMRRLYERQGAPRLDTNEGLAACGTPAAVHAAVQARTRAGFLIAEGAHSHHMVQAYLGGRSFDVLHPIPVAVAGSTEWHLRISLNDASTANTVSDAERGKPVYSITDYDTDLPRYMGLTLIDLLRVALFDIFPGHARGPRFGLDIAMTAEFDEKELHRTVSAMAGAPSAANRELLRSMLKSIDVDETGMIDEWPSDDAVVAATGMIELNRADDLFTRHTPDSKKSTGDSIRRNLSPLIANMGALGVHLRALIDRARTWTTSKDGKIRSEDAPLAAVLTGDALLPGLVPSAQLFVPALWFRPDIDRHLHGWLADGAPMWAPLALNNVQHAGLIARHVVMMRDAAPALYAAVRSDREISRILVPLFTGLAGITADHAHVP